MIPLFSITAAKNFSNHQMLLNLKSFFGEIGHVIKNDTDNTYNYRVMGYKICLIVRSHFNNYPLMTNKLVYFILGSKVLDFIENKEHLTKTGLAKIIAINFAFKYVVSSELLNFFS